MDCVFIKLLFRATYPFLALLLAGALLSVGRPAYALAPHLNEDFGEEAAGAVTFTNIDTWEQYSSLLAALNRGQACLLKGDSGKRYLIRSADALKPIGTGAGAWTYRIYDLESGQALIFKLYENEEWEHYYAPTWVPAMYVYRSREARTLGQLGQRAREQHQEQIGIPRMVDEMKAAKNKNIIIGIVTDMPVGVSLRKVLGSRVPAADGSWVFRDAAGNLRPYTLELVLDWAAQIAEILDFIHADNTVHGDVKPENLILDANGRIWLIDYETCHKSGEINVNRVNTARYAPPEQTGIWEKRYTRAAMFLRWA